MNVDACAGQQVLENALAVACVRTLLFSKVLLFFSAFYSGRAVSTHFHGLFVVFLLLFLYFRRASEGPF